MLTPYASWCTGRSTHPANSVCLMVHRKEHAPSQSVAFWSKWETFVRLTGTALHEDLYTAYLNMARRYLITTVTSFDFSKP